MKPMRVKLYVAIVFLTLMASMALGACQSAPIRDIRETIPQTQQPEKTPLPVEQATPLPTAETTASSISSLSQPYTIAWMSDTQHYSANYPDTFLAMTRFLNTQQSALGIGYIVHTGDIVSSGQSEKEWNRARAAMDEIVDIPNGVLAGNHDRLHNSDKNYLKYFGEAYYKDKPWYGGNYRDNINHYDLITLGQTSYVFVYLSYEPNSNAISWANNVFRTYSARVGVLCTHDYLDSNSNLEVNGQKLQQKVVRVNPNIYLVLCGHRYTVDEVPVRLDDNGDGIPDRTVYQCIANYQNLEKGGSGYIRFMVFDESAGSIRFYTYSPLLNAFGTAPEQATCKTDTLPIPWKQ